MPKVSVIIPNYNHAAYLKLRIDSVLEQTFQDFEVIILDDCSSDNSREVIEQYRNHPRVSEIILNKENSGSTFKQWQKGINLSKGDWIWIAESDDYCDNQFLDKLYNEILQTDSVLGFCLSEVDANNNPIRKRPLSIPNNVIKGDEYIFSNLVYQNDIYNASMVVFSKKNVDKNLFESLSQYKYAGDWLFFGDIARKGNVVEIHEYLNYFRRHSNNVSNPSMKKGLRFTEGLEAVKILKKNLNVKRIYFIKRWLRKWWMFHIRLKFSLSTNLLIMKKIIKASLVR